MFRKVLGYTAFAIGGLVAFKLAAVIFGLVLSILFQLALLALIAFAIYTAVGFFYPAVFGAEKGGDDTTVEEAEVSADAVEYDDQASEDSE